MNNLRFSPVMGLLLVVLAFVAIAVVFSADSNRAKPQQTASITESTSEPISSPGSSPAPTFPPPQPTSPPPVASESPVLTPTSAATPEPTPSVWTYPPIPNPNEEEERAEAERYELLFTQSGVVIGEGTNITPTGYLNLLTYRLEEVQFTEPLEFTPLTVGFVTVDQIWRITITGGPFPGRAMSPMIFLNDSYAGTARISGFEQQKVVSILFEDALLQEGATISVIYPGDDPQDSTLPEQLHLTR